MSHTEIQGRPGAQTCWGILESTEHGRGEGERRPERKGQIVSPGLQLSPSQPGTAGWLTSTRAASTFQGSLTAAWGMALGTGAGGGAGRPEVWLDQGVDGRATHLKATRSGDGA